MEIKISSLLIFVLLYTVHCTPTKSNDFDMGDYDVQNDDNYDGENYGDTDDPVEESKMPKVPLKIITPGQQFVRDLGETVTLPCEIIGSNFVQIWRKKNSKVQDAILFQSGIRMSTAPNVNLKNGSLEITNLHAQDAGEYSCIAMETAADRPFIQHEVILRVPPQIESLTVRDGRTLLKNGDTLILTCKTKGYPEPVISWHKGSTRLDIQGPELQIEQVKHRDAGTYKCLADNKVGEPAFSHIDIKVEYKPVISIEKIVVSSDNNSETELECLVHSEPKAAVVWLKDGENVVSGERAQFKNIEHRHNLILKDLRDSDFGVYTCSATNSLGTSQKNISLVRTPAVHRFRKSEADAKVVLTWDVQSKSDLLQNELLYRRKGEKKWNLTEAESEREVVSIGNGLYEVKYTFNRGLDPGDYEVEYRAENMYGWSPKYSDKMTVQVYAKHGHHKTHKKGHKHGKERQTTPTPTLPSQPETPAEHQEGEVQSGSVKQSGSSDGNGSTSSSMSFRISPISIAVFAFVQVRLLASMRL